jgi:hypothetical protein
LEQYIERGTNELEVTEAIRNGNHKPAKEGRLESRYNFQFAREWQGNSMQLNELHQSLSKAKQKLS